jgi:hypothetical protein
LCPLRPAQYEPTQGKDHGVKAVVFVVMWL